jgi:hypothetical protein
LHEISGTCSTHERNKKINVKFKLIFFNERDMLKYLALDKIVITKDIITKRVEIAAMIYLLHDRDHGGFL